jgi:PAS domain S-box-containing protein
VAREVEQARFAKTMRIDIRPESLALGRPLQRRRKTAVVTHGGGPLQAEPGADAKRDFKELLEGIYDGALITDMGGTVQDANGRAAHLLGGAVSDLVDAWIGTFVSGSDDAFVRMILRGLSDERHVLIQAHARKLDGTEFPAEIAVNRLRLTRRPTLCFLVRDISERTAAQNQLRIEHRAIQNAGSAVAIAHPNGRLVYANPALFRMWELNPASTDVVTLTLESLLANEEDSAHIMDVVSRGEGCTGEVSAVRPDGRTFLVAMSAAADVVEGEIDGLIFSFADIDARRKAEEALRDYQGRLEDMIGERTRELREAVARLEQHNREKSEFVSNVSHELRTPLTSMAYATDNLLSGIMGPLEPTIRRYLSMIRDDCNRLTRTVNDILDLSRIEARRARRRTSCWSTRRGTRKRP